MAMFAGDSLVCVRDENGAFPPSRYVRLFLDSFSYKLSVDKKIVTNKDFIGYGLPLDTVTIPGAPEITFSTKMSNYRTIMGMALGGTATTFTEAQGTVTTKTIELTGDYFYDLGDTNIGNVSLKSTDNATTYIEGVDWISRPRDGFVSKHPNSSLIDGEYKVTYTTLGRTGFAINSGDTPNAIIRMKAVLRSLSSAQTLDVYIPEMSVASDTEYSMLQDDHIEVKLTGSYIYGTSGELPSFKLNTLSALT
jgi:hypothetical protein